MGDSQWGESRRVKVNLLYKKKTATIFFSSVPLFVNIVHSSWGMPGWRCEAHWWVIEVSNFHTHRCLQTSTPCFWHNVKQSVVCVLFFSKAFITHWVHKNWHWTRLMLQNDHEYATAGRCYYANSLKIIIIFFCYSALVYSALFQSILIFSDIFVAYTAGIDALHLQ